MATENTSTRNAIASKLFCRRDDVPAVLEALAEGKAAKDIDAAQSRVFGDAETAIFAFSNGETRTVDFDTFSDAITRCLTLYGIAQKLGDAYALSKDQVEAAINSGLSKVEAAIEAFDGMLENLEGDDWATERATGPRNGLVIEAYGRFVRDSGKFSDDECAEKVATATAAMKDGTTLTIKGEEKTLTGAEYKALLMANAKIAGHMSDIKIERETARKAKLAEKVSEMDADDDDALMA